MVGVRQDQERGEVKDLVQHNPEAEKPEEGLRNALGFPLSGVVRPKAYEV